MQWTKVKRHGQSFVKAAGNSYKFVKKVYPVAQAVGHLYGVALPDLP